MKKSFLLAITLCSALSQTHAWTEGAKHPLYDALTVKEVIVPHDFLEVTVKEIGRVKCTKSTLPRISPISTTQTQINCDIPADLNHVEAQELFEKVNVEENDTAGAYASYKQVGKLLMVGSDDTEEGQEFAKVYTKHPCQSVKTKKDATECMDFFAVALQPSFEDINTSALVSATKKNEALALEVFKVFAPWNVDKIQGTLAKTPYIGMMVQHIYAGRHMNYYTVEKGTNVLPKEILNINLEDFGYAVEELVEGMNEEELKEFGEKLLDNLLLGLPRSAFPAFSEDVIYGFEYF